MADREWLNPRARLRRSQHDIAIRSKAVHRRWGTVQTFVGALVVIGLALAPSLVMHVGSGSPADPAVLSVRETLTMRVAGQIEDLEDISVGGRWFDIRQPRSCQPPDDAPGELEIYCRDGEFGIADPGPADPISHLTPWIAPDIAQQFGLLKTNPDGTHATGMIVVIGHFGDRRAAECRATAAALCSERLVVERIVSFDMRDEPRAAIPWSQDTSRIPISGSDCAGVDAKYSFAGWTTTAELGLTFDRPGSVYALITQDPVLLGGPDWNADPNGSDHRFRVWGRMICIAQVETLGVVEFSSIDGSEFVEWDDGKVIAGRSPAR